MSIIHDALKKTQQNLNSSAEIKTSKSPSPQKLKQKSPIQSTIILIIVSICALAAITKVILENRTHQLIDKNLLPAVKPPVIATLKPLAKIVINPATISSQKPISTTTTPIALNIHGIMSNASGNVALINDEVYQEGDMIGGAKIVRISLDDITVNVNGTSEIIHVKD